MEVGEEKAMEVGEEMRETAKKLLGRVVEGQGGVRYTLVERKGDGSFGSVFKAKVTTGG